MNETAKVKQFWDDTGKTGQDGELVTHKDLNQVNLEIESVLNVLKPNDILLDVGCGNGYCTSLYANACKQAVGIDYSEEMIEGANKNYQKKNLNFTQKNVLEIDKSFGCYSVILSTRCLINLDSWENQKKAIECLHECLADDGLFILIEGSQQGRKALNELRVSEGLEAMPPVWHNIDFDEKKLAQFMSDKFQLINDRRMGLYDVMTRVLYPLSIQPQQPQYRTPYHDSARKIFQSLSEDPYPQYSREFILVYKKGARA